MDIEEAIQMAIAYETRICDMYRETAAKLSDPAGQRTLQMLGDDEQRHIDYLNDRLTMWQKVGRLSTEKLESVIPSAETLKKGVEKVGEQVPEARRREASYLLNQALKMEIETCAFYEKMVAELPDAGKDLFARFLEIETNHIAAVQFELDYILKSGYWFDMKEFDLED